ncbi:MAG: hypothetical protein ACOC22_02415 [bacterium]
MKKRKKKKTKSYGEYYINYFLKYNNINFIREKKFENCRSNKNYPLRFDFYLPEYNILIEFQGKHHYMPVHKYRKAKIIHYKTIENDKIKKEFCENNNISLIEINYKEIDNIYDKLIEELEKIIPKK